MTQADLYREWLKQENVPDTSHEVLDPKNNKVAIGEWELDAAAWKSQGRRESHLLTFADGSHLTIEVSQHPK